MVEGYRMFEGLSIVSTNEYFWIAKFSVTFVVNANSAIEYYPEN